MGSIFRRLRTGAKTCMHQYVEKPMLSKWRGVTASAVGRGGSGGHTGAVSASADMVVVQLHISCEFLADLWDTLQGGVWRPNAASVGTGCKHRRCR
jgi:hypothetical protein